MIIMMDAKASEIEIEKIKESIIGLGCEVNEYQNQNHRILGLLGDTSKINIGLLKRWIQTTKRHLVVPYIQEVI